MSTGRKVLWAIGAPARLLLLGGIKVYRATLSGLLGGQCRFYPTCSQYAEDAIRARGAVVGSGLAAWRILRCNPFGRGGVEAAPGPRGAHAADVKTYETVTPRREVSAS